MVAMAVTRLKIYMTPIMMLVVEEQGNERAPSMWWIYLTFLFVISLVLFLARAVNSV